MICVFAKRLVLFVARSSAALRISRSAIRKLLLFATACAIASSTVNTGTPESGANVTLSRFDGNMAQQELDLVEFATSGVTEPGARPAAVMRRKVLHADSVAVLLHRVPDHLLRHPLAPHRSESIHTPEQPAFGDGGCCRPLVQRGLYPRRDRNRADVSSFADQIAHRPMVLPLL